MIGVAENGLLGQYSIEDFFKFQARNESVYIPAEEIGEPVCLEIDDIESRITYNKILVNNLSMSRDSDAIPKERYSDGVFVDPSLVKEEFQAGGAITFRAAHLFFPEVARLADRFENAWNCEAQGNLYVAPAGSNATQPHFDPHELFIFQLKGEKVWHLFEGGYYFPETHDGFDPCRHPIGQPYKSIRLSEGDILFLPRGTVHQPVADTASMHLALGLKGLSNSQVLCDVIKLLSSVDLEFRRLAFQGKSDSMISQDLSRLMDRVSDYLEDEEVSRRLFDKISQQARQPGRPSDGWLLSALGDASKPSMHMVPSSQVTRHVSRFD